jgi:hypothetical protein
MGRFIEDWVLNGMTGRMNQKIDEVRSEYPPIATGGPSGGYYATVGEAGSATSMLSVPSATRFKIRTIVIDNATAPNIIRFYTSGSGASCAATLLAFHIGASQTEVIDIKGITIDKDLYISHLLSNIVVRVGGLMIASGPV